MTIVKVMTVSLRAKEVPYTEVKRIVADIKATGRYEHLEGVRVLTDPILVYGKRWEFDIATQP